MFLLSFICYSFTPLWCVNRVHYAPFSLRICGEEIARICEQHLYRVETPDWDDFILLANQFHVVLSP